MVLKHEQEMEELLKEQNTIPSDSKVIMCVVEENEHFISKREALNIIANLATQVNIADIKDEHQG